MTNDRSGQHQPEHQPEHPEPAHQPYPGIQYPGPQYPASEYSQPQYPYDPAYPFYGAYPPHPGYAGFPPPEPTKPPRRGVRWRVGAGIAALTAAAVVGGVAIGQATAGSTSGNGSAIQLMPGTGGSSGSGPGSGSGSGSGTLPGLGGLGGSGSLPGGLGGGTGGTGGQGSTSSVGIATDAQQKGIVTVVSVLKYQNAESAGTGMILTSNGEILTNNHVIDGATSITVTVASTGRSYQAQVVGTAPSEDVAVLQLKNASGLTTAKLGDSSDVAVGDKVVGVGNAGGTGTLRASNGQVTALNQTITATDDTGQQGERLDGLIQVNAPIISGDSGGPLYDSSGEVIGMDTAASSNPSAATAYAIPIDDAVKVADQIEQGVETSTIHIGLPAFLGVGVADDNGAGAGITSLLDGGPAADAGITDGSVITAVGGKKVTSADSLKTALLRYNPGDKAKITWTDPNGSSHTKTVTLATGPAD